MKVVKSSHLFVPVCKTSCKFHLLFFVLIITGLFTAPVSLAQQPPVSRNSFSDNWMFTPTVGFTQFYGDISSQNFFQKFKGATSIGADFTARKMFTPVFGAGANIYYHLIRSAKYNMGNGTPVNFQVYGNYFDFNVRGYLDFLNLFTTYSIDNRFSLLGSLGIGYGFWNSTLTDNNTGTSVSTGQASGANVYKRSAFVVPIGLTGSYRFADNWSVDLGVDFRTVLNDDVDVWRDGFKFDQLLYVKTGVTYYLNYGWGHRRRPKVQVEDDECCEEQKPMAPIPVYDYRPPSKRTSAKPAHIEPVETAQPEPVEVKTTLPQGFEYRVQIMAKAKRRENTDRLQARYNLDYPVEEHFQDGLWLYTVGHFSSYNEALQTARKIKNKGVFDAFVTAYQNGRRIPLTKSMRK